MFIPIKFYKIQNNSTMLKYNSINIKYQVLGDKNFNLINLEILWISQTEIIIIINVIGIYYYHFVCAFNRCKDIALDNKDFQINNINCIVSK